MSDEGMTMAEVQAEMARPENANRVAVYAYANPDGTYRSEWDGREVTGVNCFQLDSNLTQIGAPMRRNLFLLAESAGGV